MTATMARKPASANENLRAQLAEHVAQGGTFAAFSRAQGISLNRTRSIWARIAADMGPQAA